MFCWLLAIVGLSVAAVAFYYLARIGSALAVQRDRQQHLAIVNAARRRAGKPPITEADLPPEPEPERDPLIEKLLGTDPGRGFDVLTPRVEPASPAPQPVVPLTSAPPTPASPVASATPKPVIVLLDAKPRDLTADRLRTAIEKAWGVAIPDTTDGTDWVVLTAAGMGMISCGGYQFMVENHATPYFPDPEAAASAVREARTQTAVRNGRAWRSVALLGDAPDLTDDAAYALLAKLAAELAGNDTLGIFLPRLERFFPYDTTTLKALLAEDPLTALREADIQWVPLMPSDDRELERAIAEARRRLGEFKEAFASRSITGSGKRSPYLVKARFGEEPATEHMWVEVTDIRGDRFTGVLRSTPLVVPDLVEGEVVTVLADDISDWIATLNGQPIGDFTAPVIRRRHESNR